ncbi:FxsA family protein [Paenibacillus yanchengensis]|uniref:FxsA family protein n=1 Tax=Paenibacillus yanchengensis TaxID=2035833 RepID=A0ABW4YLB2_9BACL
MKKWWLLLFILVPVIEIWGIAQVSNQLGGLLTLTLLFLIVALGFYILRVYGLRAWQTVAEQLAAGQPPGFAMLDGICIFVGAVLLMIPGFFTDIVALLLLIPFTRPIFKKIIFHWLEKLMKSGRFTMIGRF